MLLANRRNAQKSTGPRTAEGRRRVALARTKPSDFVRSLSPSLEPLGDGAAKLGRWVKQLLAYHRPQGPTETMLVEDIATLELERRRIERAQCALLARQIEQEENTRIRRAANLVNPKELDGPNLLDAGVRRAPDSLTKFKNLMGWLEILIDQVGRRDYSQEGKALLEFIYGLSQTWWGNNIPQMYEQLFSLRASASAAPTETPGEEPTPEPGVAEEAEPSPQQELDEEMRQEAERKQEELAKRLRAKGVDEEALRRELLQGLLEEERDVIQEYTLFADENIRMTSTLRSALLAPSGPQWPVMLRQKNSVDRQIERKLKLLLRLQAARRRGGEPSSWTAD